MRTLAVILIAVAFPSMSAIAQVPTSAPQSAAFGNPIIRITAAFRTAVEGADPRTVPDAKAQEAARRTLYDMAARECAVLSELFKAECRLSSVQMPAPLIQPITNTNPAQNATAVYELRPRDFASER
jgi:hypothetical protein